MALKEIADNEIGLLNFISPLSLSKSFSTYSQEETNEMILTSGCELSDFLTEFWGVKKEIYEFDECMIADDYQSIIFYFFTEGNSNPFKAYIIRTGYKNDMSISASYLHLETTSSGIFRNGKERHFKEDYVFNDDDETDFNYINDTLLSQLDIIIN